VGLTDREQIHPPTTQTWDSSTKIVRVNKESRAPSWRALNVIVCKICRLSIRRPPCLIPLAVGNIFLRRASSNITYHNSAIHDAALLSCYIPWPWIPLDPKNPQPGESFHLHRCPAHKFPQPKTPAMVLIRSDESIIVQNLLPILFLDILNLSKHKYVDMGRVRFAGFALSHLCRN